MFEAEKADPASMMTVTRMCARLGMERRRFYEWRAQLAAGPSPRQRRAAALTEKIRQFHAASDGTYGAPRIHADLQDAGVAVPRKTIAKLMRADGITGISPRTWHRRQRSAEMTCSPSGISSSGASIRTAGTVLGFPISPTCTLVRAGRISASSATVIPDVSWAGRSAIACTPILSRTRCGKPSRREASCRGRSPSMPTAGPVHQRPAR